MFCITTSHTTLYFSTRPEGYIYEFIFPPNVIYVYTRHDTTTNDGFVISLLVYISLCLFMLSFRCRVNRVTPYFTVYTSLWLYEYFWLYVVLVLRYFQNSFVWHSRKVTLSWLWYRNCALNEKCLWNSR